MIASKRFFEQLVSHARVINMSGNRVVFSAADCDEFIGWAWLFLPVS